MDRPHHLGQPVRVAPAGAGDAADWLGMRLALWPEAGRDIHAAEIAALVAAPGDTTTLIARETDGTPLGFVEASLRHDYVNGCETSPVGFVEGLYVVPAARGRGVGRALMAAVEQWAGQKGCTELASDTELDNVAGQAMHEALGFAETERIVFFRKRLTPPGAR